MSEEEKKNTNLVSSGSKSLVTRSSGLAKRGLELLSSPQERTIYFPTDRSIGVLKVLGEDKRWTGINARGKITVPKGSRLWFDAAEPPPDASLLTLILLFGKKPETHITDSDLSYLQTLNDLQWLDLSHTNIVGTGLSYLQGLHSLEILHLKGTMINDDGLINLPELPLLHELILSKTKITGTGLTYLRRLHKL